MVGLTARFTLAQVSQYPEGEIGSGNLVSYLLMYLLFFSFLPSVPRVSLNTSRVPSGRVGVQGVRAQ